MADGVLRHVEPAMGTVFSIDVRDADGLAPGALDEAIRWLHWVEDTFSTYRPDSQISRLDDGTLHPRDCHPEVSAVLARCDELAAATGGYFSVRPSGRLDPAGYVKGWAIERAVALLRDAGSRHQCINGGGDVRALGPATRPPWRVGIVDPADRARLVAVASGRDLAVATSGTAERGRHIVDPHGGRAATGFRSLTVTGPDLGLADAYATAAFAMGPTARGWLEGLDDFEGFAVLPDGTPWKTAGFPSG